MEMVSNSKSNFISSRATAAPILMTGGQTKFVFAVHQVYNFLELALLL